MQTHALAFLAWLSLLDNIQKSCEEMSGLSAQMHAFCVYEAMPSVKGKLHQRLNLFLFFISNFRVCTVLFLY